MSRGTGVAITTCLVVIAVLAGLNVATAGPSYPRPQGWVNDYADVLSPDERAGLEGILSDLDAKTDLEVAVVTVKYVPDNMTPKQYATGLFNDWKVGKRGLDNGLLVLLAVGNRRVEVETGYGLEERLPDGKVGRILDESFVPLARKNRFGPALLNLVSALSRELTTETTEPGSEAADPGQGAARSAAPNPIGPVGILLLIFGTFLAFGLVIWAFMVWVNRTSCPKCKFSISFTTRELRAPTFFRNGREERTYACEHCHHTFIRRVAIPCLLLQGLYDLLRAGGSPGGSGFGGFGGGSSGGGGAGRSF